MVLTEYLKLQSNGNNHFINLTSQVSAIVQNCGLKDGTVTLFVPGSTAGLSTIEFEEGALKDLDELLQRLVPQGHPYHHDAAWGDANGFSHLRACLLGPSLTVPFSSGKLHLGTWQQIVFMDFDNRPRRREIVCQIMGE
ncbi:MAG: secondary thiamine-phosphate synthase enzyme YjbQ [Acidobacteriota bacterium]